MKVLLIQAYLGRRAKREVLSFPLGLAYLLESLKNHECTVFDPNTVDQPFAETQKIIDKTDPDVIGLSLRNIDTAQSWDVFSYFEAFASMIKLVKRVSPHAKIVVGGPGFSIFPQEIMMKLEEIDYGVFLEGEYSFSRLLEELHHPERVEGIYFRRNGKIFSTGTCKPIDFGKSHAPPREFPELDLKSYKKVAYSIGVQTKRGCAFRCAYCTYPYIQGRNIRMRSPKKVIDEIESLVYMHDVKDFFFADTVFNYPPDHSRKICEGLIQKKLQIKWRAWFREDFINRRFISTARDSGCDVFEFSPDGGSQEALDILRKDIDIQNIIRTYELIQTVNETRFVCNFMYNIPGENVRTVLDFYKFLFRITTRYLKKLHLIGLSNIRIYPHTKMYQIALKQRVINERTDLLTPTFYETPPFNAAYFPGFNKYSLLPMWMRALSLIIGKK